MRTNRIRLNLRPDESTPSFVDEHRGQLRIEAGDGTTTTDKLKFGRNRAGTDEWVDVVMSNDVPNVTVQNADVTVGSKASVLDFSNDFVVSESPTNELNIDLVAAVAITLGPYFLNDVPGTATTNLFTEFFNTTTATGIGTTGSWFVPFDGRVLGAFLQSDAGRTAGTAQLRPTISGTGQSFSGGNPTLDATNTARHSVLKAWANGISFTAGQRVGCELITSGWTPITANVTALIVVAMNP